MSLPPDPALWHALYSLEARYWRDVDCNDGRNAHEFYVPECVFRVGDNKFCGQQKIREFYLWREQRGLTTVRTLRTTRHLISNFVVEPAGEREAKAFGLISFFEAPGRAPVMAASPPILIADLENVCVKGEDDRWRFKTHLLRPVFMGDDVPLSLAVDLSR
jgi:hypothetical protein